MKLVILDRDGVINKELGRYVYHQEEFELIPFVAESIQCIKKLGYHIGIATNQAGIAKGLYTHLDLALIHCKMLSLLEKNGGDIDRILYCESADDLHPKRKPNPGMIKSIITDYNLLASDVYFVGDTIRDVKAAISASCQPVLLRTGKPLPDMADLEACLGYRVLVFDHLKDFSIYLKQKESV